MSKPDLFERKPEIKKVTKFEEKLCDTLKKHERWERAKEDERG
jgi:hypothetical protein